MEEKLLKRPIDSNTKIKSEKIVKKDTYVFLFEESFWDGIYIKSIILSREQFKDYSQITIELIIKKYFDGIVNQEATYSVKNDYIFYNYEFRVG